MHTVHCSNNQHFSPYQLKLTMLCHSPKVRSRVVFSEFSPALANQSGDAKKIKGNLFFI